MPRAFLSHSSADKKSYVEMVAKKLGYNTCVYDEFSFEEGMKSAEEIMKGLSRSDLFVLFLSDSALESNWVKNELNTAQELLNTGDMKRILPIIIDKNITYKDNRIPQWLRDEYNLKYVSRPTVAARRITQKLREISWEQHPRLKEKDQIFVGRNNLTKTFEERIDAFDLQTPTCIFASGIRKIGRRTLLKNCLTKSNVVDDSYQPPIITLNSHEGLEDFIIRIYDLGFSGEFNLSDFMTTEIDHKIGIATELIRDIQVAKEILFILDNGCIITPDREINQWFLQILSHLPNQDRVTFGIASSFRLDKKYIRTRNNIFYIEVPELDKVEREGLLKRYSKFEKLELQPDELKFFGDLLNGYPEQVYYAVDLIKDLGIFQAKKDSYLIQEFNTERVNILMNKYDNNQKSKDFLYFLSEFEFVDYDFIFEIVGDEEFYINLLNELLASAICEHLGANKEYIRINDIIRDFVKRNNLSLPKEYKDKLEDHLNNFLSNYQKEEKSAADLLYSMKEALIQGKSIDEKYLIPSQFLKTMTELYDRHKRYGEIVKLADRVLQNEEYMDHRITEEIRYYLCLALARQKDSRFLQEVQKIDGANHDFLFGFFFRITGNYRKAIERLETAIEKRPHFSFAERELVNVYLLIGDFERALTLAKQNYERDKNNPYHIQAYFRCLIAEDKINGNEEKMEELLDNLNKLKTEKAKQMYMRAKAQYLAFHKDDEIGALELADLATKTYSHDIYCWFTKFDICEKYDKIDEMGNILKVLDKMIDKNSSFYSILINLKALYLAKSDQKPEALKLVFSLNNYPENALDKIIKRIESTKIPRMNKRSIKI